jgi:preprotein translocase subunit SecA
MSNSLGSSPLPKPSASSSTLSTTEQKSKEGSLQVLHIIDDKPDPFQDIIKKYIRSESSKIEDMIKECVEKKEEVSLFAICNLEGEKRKFIQQQNEHWIAFSIVKSNGIFLVFIKDSLESKEYNDQKNEFKKFLVEKFTSLSKIDFIEHNNREESTVNGSDISIALNNIKLLMEIFRDGKEKEFQEIKFSCTHSKLIDFDRKIVEIGLSNGFKFRLKSSLQNVVSALKRVVDKNNEYQLDNERFINLIKTLESRNFEPENDDKIYLKEIVINLIIIFKEKGQEIDKNIHKILTEYFQKEKKKGRYAAKISEFDKTLKEDSRNSQVKGCLGIALNDQVKFLTRMGKLSSELLTLVDIDELIKFLGDNNQQKVLEDRKTKLENQQNISTKHDELIDISYEISEIRKQFDYYIKKSEISKTINIDELIILLGDKVENSQSSKRDDILSPETIDKIIEIGKTTENKQVALAIIKIFNFIDVSKFSQIETTLDKVLPQISQNKAEIVVTLTDHMKTGVTKYPSLLKFLHHILFENEDKIVRNKTFNILHDIQYISEVVKLEEKCLENDKKLLDDCFEHVKIGNKLTLNCFERLANFFNENKTNEILTEIIEQEIQQLPKFFIEKFHQYLESFSNDKKSQTSIISISKSLIKGQYITISQIHNIIEKLIYDERVTNDIFDILFIEIKNEHSIPESIVNKLKHSEYATNLIKLIEKKFNDIDVLKNPRKDLMERKEALKKIVNDSRNHSLDTVKTFETLIKYDLELRTDCFQKLVEILPQNYTKKNFNIDLHGIAECVYDDKNISIEDIQILVKKDTDADLSYILPLIIHRINSNQEAALNLLTEISRLKQGGELIFGQIKDLWQIVSSSTDFDLRAKIVSIIKNSVKKEDQEKIEILKRNSDGTEIRCSFIDELNKLDSLQKLVINEDTLDKLRKIIEEEFAIAEDHVKLLIDALGNSEHENLHEEISCILLQIYCIQDFSDITSYILFNKIKENPKLISIANVVGIIAVGLSKSIEIPDEVIKYLWEQLISDVKDKALKYNLIYAIRELKSIPKSGLEIIGKYFTSKDDDIQFRLAIAEMLSIIIEQSNDYFEISQTVFDLLRIVALEPKNNHDEDLLNKIVFSSLEISIKENNFSHVFLSKYYEIFKQRIISLEKCSAEELNPLDAYISTELNALKKFHLLNVLNNTFLTEQKIDTTVFTEFDDSQWQKEILCSELITGTFQEIHPDEGIDEFELQKFRENIDSLSKFIRKPNSIENTLQLLIDKRNTYHINLKNINTILIMLQSGEETFHLLQSDDENFSLKLCEFWLVKRLKYLNIECTQNKFEILMHYLPYRINIIIEIFLNMIKEGTQIDELIKFFSDLSDCGLTQESRQYFLIHDIPHKQSIEIWRLILVDKLIGALLSKKFPSYRNYLKHNYKFDSNTNVSIKNPYNQANTTYRYSAEDIKQISSEWMKEFVKNFRITLVLDRNLSKILTEFKQDKKSTIIILDIAENHWVTLALLHYKDKYIALYKDSLGVENKREEVKTILTNEIENIHFKFHKSSDQFDDYNCGVFALANMKIMATKLRDKKEVFIENFETHNFISQKEAIEYRQDRFPKIYALSFYQKYKTQKVIDHHSVELESIKELLRKKETILHKFQLSVDLPQEENLIDKNYRYLYVIKAENGIDRELKSRIESALGIKEFYSVERNILKVLNEKQTVAIQKKEKLDLNQLKIDIIDIDYSLMNKLHKKLMKISLSGWPWKSIKELIKLIDSNDKIQHLLNALDPIYEYNLKEYDDNIKDKNLIDILKSSRSKDWAKEIHDLAIFQTFKGSYNKDLEKLTREIFEINKDNRISFLSDDKLIIDYQNVKNAYENKSKLFDDFDVIKHWKSSQIEQWAEKIKHTPNQITQYEKLAVIKRGVEITSKFPPREIQLLSVLIMINSDENTGRLSQINTGEGKTTIVAMLAAIKALEGHKIDIVTSSPELAKPQSEQQKMFFDKFGLTVSHNGKDGTDIKERYKADIIYGAASDFQGDILRDEYSKIGTRSGRKCDVAIVDEVDSMLIDGKNHIVMLSSPMPAMDHLEPLLSIIWIQIEEIAKSIIEVNGKVFYVEPDMLDENGKLKLDTAKQAYPIKGTKENFVKNCTEMYIRKVLRDKEGLEMMKQNTDGSEFDSDIPPNLPEIKIPIHLKDFVIKIQLTKWIDSAIYAKYRCQNGKHYILRNSKIAPVDAINTGIVQQNMHWNNGLHQFLQIKHGAKITPESLTTNFLSNVTYFRRYGKNIFGLTGTLGSINARELLKKIYSIDCVIIPSFRQKQHKELTSIITDNENDWYDNIVESCINKLNQNRGVLVITKYIKEVEEIKNKLITATYNASKIKVYKTEDDSKVIEEELKPGEIIIATNIAGRGTDIKADKLEKYGGLHVCITFLPPNERVEQQNVGRTSRTGNKGTSQFILLEKNAYDINELKRIRDKKEENEIKESEMKIKKVTIKDDVFAEFCKLLNEIENKTDFTMKIKIRAIEDRFGIWLRIQDEIIEKTTDKDKILKNFEKFKKEIFDDKENNRLIKNPCFHVLIGNDLVNQKKYQAAIEEFSRAISLDEYFQANAYYNRGYARIAEYGGYPKSHRQKIEEAIEDFKKAKRIIEENFEPMLHIIQKASSSEALSEQVSHKMNLFGVQKNAIEMAIGADVDKEIAALEEQKKQEGIQEDGIDKIDKNIKQLKDNKKSREMGVIKQALKNERELEIEIIEIEKSLPEDQDVNLYKEEIEEYKNNGFQGGFQVKEVKPIDWWSVAGLTLLGLGQIIGGAAIVVFSLGAGSTVGMGLLFEGVSDLITAVKDGIINRDFSWISYGIQKAISIAVSLVCAGLGAIKDAAKTAAVGVKTVGSMVTKAATETVKAGWKIAAKAIGTELAKGVAKQLVTQLVDYGVNKALMPSIEDEIMKRIEGPIQQALLNNPEVEKMLRLDGLNRNNYYQSLIKKKAIELLNPQNDSEHVLLTITKGIAKGIATTKISGLSTILQITEAIQALDELNEFVPKFIENLNKAIDELSRTKNINKILEDLDKQQQQQQEKTESQVNDEHKQTKQETEDHTVSNYVPELAVEDIDLSKSQSDEEKVQLERERKSPEELRKDLAYSVSNKMCDIIQNKLITPVAHIGVHFGMRKLTAGLDENISNQIGNYQAERRIEFFQDGDKSNRIPDEFKQGLKDKEAVEKVDTMIDDLKKGGEAGLPHLGSLSDETGRPIKVLDENGRVIRIIGNDKDGVPIEVEYHKANENNPNGHWTLPGGKEPAINNTGKNNCLFNVIAHQTGKDPNRLRADTATQMENNKAILANQAHDIKRLEQYKNNALTMGGARVQIDDPKIDYQEGTFMEAGNLTFEAQFELIPKGNEKLKSSNGYIEVNNESSNVRTVCQTKNWRLDNQGPTANNRYENYQIQRGGEKFYPRKPGESTTTAHVLLTKPTSSDTTYCYSARKVSNAFNISLNQRKTVILSPNIGKKK